MPSLRRLRRLRDRARRRGQRVRARRLQRRMDRIRARRARRAQTQPTAPSRTVPAAAVRADDVTLRVVGQNLGGNRPVRTTPRRTALAEQALDALFAFDPDVVLAQETGSVRRHRPGYVHYGGDTRHCSAWVRDGVTVLNDSRPLLSLPTPSRRWHGFGHLRQAQRVVVADADGQPVTCVSAHLTPPRGIDETIEANQQGQARLIGIVRDHQRAGHRVVVSIDANLGLGRALTPLRDALSWTTHGIDWLGTTRGTRIHTRLLPSNGSDHPGHLIDLHRSTP